MFHNQFLYNMDLDYLTYNRIYDKRQTFVCQKPPPWSLKNRLLWKKFPNLTTHFDDLHTRNLSIYSLQLKKSIIECQLVEYCIREVQLLNRVPLSSLETKVSDILSVEREGFVLDILPLFFHVLLWKKYIPTRL